LFIKLRLDNFFEGQAGHEGQVGQFFLQQKNSFSKTSNFRKTINYLLSFHLSFITLSSKTCRLNFHEQLQKFVD
jgi:hypothetical protein